MTKANGTRDNARTADLVLATVGLLLYTAAFHALYTEVWQSVVHFVGEKLF